MSDKPYPYEGTTLELRAWVRYALVSGSPGGTSEAIDYALEDFNLPPRYLTELSYNTLSSFLGKKYAAIVILYLPITELNVEDKRLARQYINGVETIPAAELERSKRSSYWKKKAIFYFTLLNAINTVHEKVIVRIAEAAAQSHDKRRKIEWISIVLIIVATLCVTSQDDLFDSLKFIGGVYGDVRAWWTAEGTWEINVLPTDRVPAHPRSG